jgi:hypothetical protein
MIRSLLPAGVVLAAAALPAAAGAATWSVPLDPCYVAVGPAPEQRQILHIKTAGFTPLQPVDVVVDGAPADTDGDGSPNQIYADENGRVIVDARVPYQSDGERPFGVSVSERANPINAANAAPEVTALTVRLRPAQAAPSRRVRFHGRGFVKRAPVWAHYLFRGKVRRTVRLVRRPHGDCGTFTVRRRQIPVARPHTGHWTLQVDQQKAYSAAPDSVFVRLAIDVQRVVRHG